MNKHIVLTVLSEDRPGVVEAIANAVSEHKGNWLESQMSRLAGKFAGIVQISVEDEKCDALTQQLRDLSKVGMTVVVDTTVIDTNDPLQKDAISSDLWQFSILGNDRPGIIREVSQAFAKRQINLEELNTECTSAPHSGIPMFSALGKIRFPSNADIDELEETLAKISDNLTIDIQLEGPE